MPKVVNNVTYNKSQDIEVGMMFETSTNDVCMLVRAGGGLYLVDLESGIEWSDCDLSDMTVKEVEEDNDMTLLNVQSIIIQ